MDEQTVLGHSGRESCRIDPSNDFIERLLIGKFHCEVTQSSRAGRRRRASASRLSYMILIVIIQMHLDFRLIIRLLALMK